MSRRIRKWTPLWAAAWALVQVSGANALTTPYAESFDGSAGGWTDAISAPVSHVSSGGSDGGGYITQDYSYFGYTSNFGGPVLFRGHDSNDASGGAFVGDWLVGGVNAVSIMLRHDAPEPLEVYMRVASAQNFPGAVIPSFGVVAPGEWTAVTFLVDPGSPACIGEGVTCGEALANVGNLQFGTGAPTSLTTVDQAFTFDLDEVSISAVPEPGTALLVGCGLWVAGAARRPRR